MIFYRYFLKLLLSVVFTFISSIGFANFLPASLNGHAELSGNVGFGKFSIGDSNFRVTATETDNLIQTHNPFVGDVDLGIFYVLPLRQAYYLQKDKPIEQSNTIWFSEFRLGLNARYISHEIYGLLNHGIIEQYQAVNMDNYRYELSISNKRLMLDLMPTIFSWHDLSMFIMGGIGYGATKINYQDKPITGVNGGSLKLNSKTKNGFNAEAGAGFFYNIAHNINFSIQYLYANFGSISTSNTGTLNGSTARIIPAKFSIDANTVLFGLYITI